MSLDGSFRPVDTKLGHEKSRIAARLRELCVEFGVIPSNATLKILFGDRMAAFLGRVCSLFRVHLTAADVGGSSMLYDLEQVLYVRLGTSHMSVLQAGKAQASMANVRGVSMTSGEARQHDALMAALLAEKDLVRRASQTSRLELAGLDKEGSFLDFESVWMFDHDFFGMTERAARQIDVRQRLLLKHAFLAVENAGLCDALVGLDVGGNVFVLC